MLIKPLRFLIGTIIICAVACKGNSDDSSSQIVYKGVYSFGPEVKSFKDCESGREFWVTDKSAQLELKYSQLNFEKPYEPVYIEVEGVKVRSGKDGMGSEYDSTLMVNKLIKISKEIPLDMCN
jgi:copper homeostasis protein (lipoprotein)